MLEKILAGRSLMAMDLFIHGVPRSGPVIPEKHGPARARIPALIPYSSHIPSRISSHIPSRISSCIPSHIPSHIPFHILSHDRTERKIANKTVDKVGR